MDDDGVVDEDDQSVHSTATTVSDSSACSNTPSLIGESLEASQGPQEAAKRKLAWVSDEKATAFWCTEIRLSCYWTIELLDYRVSRLSGY